MSRRFVPILAAGSLVLFAGACSDSGSDDEAAPEGTEEDASASGCQNNLDLVNPEAAEEVALEGGPFGAELVIADGGPKEDDVTSEDTISVVISGTDIPEPEYRDSWPAEDPGAEDGKNFMSFTLVTTAGPIEADQVFGSEDEADGEVEDVVVYNGSTELTTADLTVEITAITGDTLCGQIVTNGTDGVGVQGPFKAERT